jgi:tetratricopeptide (TPR) repeat protein
MKAEAQRGLAVVCRRLSKERDAEKHFTRATEIATEAARRLSDEPSAVDEKLTDSEVVQVSYDVAPFRVLADVHFSHGYYWYERELWDRSASLFERAIDALERADEKWDAPYTRLAIVKLRQGYVDEATDLFLKARYLCGETPPEKNREAPLSGALCTLGLDVIQSGTGVRMVNANPLEALSEALAIQPPLGLGALRCHAGDAEKLLSMCEGRDVEARVQSFITALKPP